MLYKKVTIPNTHNIVNDREYRKISVKFVEIMSSRKLNFRFQLVFMNKIYSNR